MDGEGRRGRSGKSIDFDEYSDEGGQESNETLERLSRLLRPKDLSKLRARLFGNDEQPRRRKSKQKATGKRRPRSKGFKTSKEVINSRTNVEEAELKEGIRTILKPGELEDILETGTFDWNAQRIKRYGIEDSEYVDEYEYEYEYEEEEHKDKLKDYASESGDNSKLDKEETEADTDEEESSSKRRKRILNLVEQLLNMKSDE